MAYNELMANNLRNLFSPYGEDIVEKKMFGGLSFLYKGKMCIGVIKNELVVRVVADKMAFELEKANVRAMDFTKRPLKEFIYVNPNPKEDLHYWINLGIEHARQNL